MKILVLDDDEIYASELMAILKEYKYESLWLKDSVNINEQIGLFKPDVFLCDLKMPVSGFEVAYHVNAKYPSLIILGITSYFDIHNEHWLVKICGMKKVFDKSNIECLIAYLGSCHVRFG